MSELHDSVDYNNYKFEYVSFYEYIDSKIFFHAIKNNHIKFSEVKNKQNNFLKKVNEVKISKKTAEQRKVTNNLEKFYNSREEVINLFLETKLKCYLMLITM